MRPWAVYPTLSVAKGRRMADIKRIGILTSGGDCAGLNAVIRAAVFGN